MSTYKLTYFNFRGRGEIPRLIFVKNGVKYEDIRVEFYTEEWPNFKAKTSQYNSFKSAYSIIFFSCRQSGWFIGKSSLFTNRSFFYLWRFTSRSAGFLRLIILMETVTVVIVGHSYVWPNNRKCDSVGRPPRPGSCCWCVFWSGWPPSLSLLIYGFLCLVLRGGLPTVSHLRLFGHT